MDSNVSKNTFSHKFFKLGFTNDNAPISLKYLIKQQLLQIIDFYRQQASIELDLDFIDHVLEAKIILCQSEPRRLSSKNQSQKFFLALPITSFNYSCPIALTLSSYFESTAPIIADKLTEFLISNQDNILYKSWFGLDLEVVSNGWINFYLKPQTIGAWLKLQTQLDSTIPAQDLAFWQQKKTSDNLDNLFPIQYVHAQCCCLLLLGARENLIGLKDKLFIRPNWSIKQPQTIPWFDSQHNLHFSARTEYDLLFQLMMVNDSFLANNRFHNWNKLALNLSTAVAVFLADCRFLGSVRRENQEKAIARLGLIALAQYWLQIILLEKLKVSAPKSF